MLLLDVAKRVGRVGSIGFAGQDGSFLNGLIGSQVESGWESGRVDPYFSKCFLFFFVLEVDAICQLFMSSLAIIRFSLVILSPITTKHLT